MDSIRKGFIASVMLVCCFILGTTYAKDTPGSAPVTNCVPDSVRCGVTGVLACINTGNTANSRFFPTGDVIQCANTALNAVCVLNNNRTSFECLNHTGNPRIIPFDNIVANACPASTITGQVIGGQSCQTLGSGR